MIERHSWASSANPAERGRAGEPVGANVAPSARRKECSCGFLLCAVPGPVALFFAPYHLTLPAYGSDASRKARKEDGRIPLRIPIRNRRPRGRGETFRRLLIRDLVGHRVRRGEPRPFLLRHRPLRGRVGERLGRRARGPQVGTDAPRRDRPAFRTGADVRSPEEVQVLLRGPDGVGSVRAPARRKPPLGRGGFLVGVRDSARLPSGTRSGSLCRESNSTIPKIS